MQKNEEKREERVVEREVIMCPLGKLFMDLCVKKKSKFFEHLIRSKIEFLKAIRSILDEKIEDLEKEMSPKKKVTKIEVE